MMDPISRQAAIDALMKRDKELRNFNWYDKPWAECECKGIDYALGIVNALPSVQPTQSNNSNALKTSDCIDRQAAIDTVGNMLRRKFGIGGDLAKITLAGLPPAQPEITDEQAIEHLQSTGWMQSHDRILTERRNE